MPLPSHWSCSMWLAWSINSLFQEKYFRKMNVRRSKNNLLKYRYEKSTTNVQTCVQIMLHTSTIALFREELFLKFVRGRKSRLFYNVVFSKNWRKFEIRDCSYYVQRFEANFYALNWNSPGEPVWRRPCSCSSWPRRSGSSACRWTCTRRWGRCTPPGAGPSRAESACAGRPRSFLKTMHKH